MFMKKGKNEAKLVISSLLLYQPKPCKKTGVWTFRVVFQNRSKFPEADEMLHIHSMSQNKK